MARLDIRAPVSVSHVHQSRRRLANLMCAEVTESLRLYFPRIIEKTIDGLSSGVLSEPTLGSVVRTHVALAQRLTVVLHDSTKSVRTSAEKVQPFRKCHWTGVFP